MDKIIESFNQFSRARTENAGTSADHTSSPNEHIYKQQFSPVRLSPSATVRPAPTTAKASSTPLRHTASYVRQPQINIRASPSSIRPSPGTLRPAYSTTRLQPSGIRSVPSSVRSGQTGTVQVYSNKDFKSMVSDRSTICSFDKRPSIYSGFPLDRSSDAGTDEREISMIVWACKDFGNISTLHGMKHLCANESSILRRLIWLILMICCLIVLSMHIRAQLKHFYSNPTTINVKKVYTKYMEFPAITICNDNIYKISAAHEHGLYDILNQMFRGNLTLQDVEEAGLANLTLDELNYRVGNRIDSMLLRCTWNNGEECGVQNFSTIITDYGLCFTFNGPNYTRDLTANSPGSSRGLELVLNIEEYERMVGPHVASGIHIFVHNKRDYPLVEQKGQAVAAGSHTFIALSLKKEIRLGQPYGNCIDKRMVHVPSNIYQYSRATCKVDCYVTFVVEKCGCKDYYLPGDAPVCTLTQYVTCLDDAKYEYDQLKDKLCECYNPCNAEYMEPTYSYSAMSKAAINELKPGDIENIMKRFKRALDVHEYLSEETQYKKYRYENFTQSLAKLNHYYDNFYRVKMASVVENIMKIEAQAAIIYEMADEIIQAHIFIVENNFISARQSLERELTMKLVQDHQVFSHTVINKLQEMSKTTNDNLRELLFILLTEELTGRISIATSSIEHIYQLVQAFKFGIPIDNYSFPPIFQYINGVDPITIIPKRLLRNAFERSEKLLMNGNYTRNSLTTISGYLQEILRVANDVYKNKRMTSEQNVRVEEIIADYKKASNNYLIERDTFNKETVQWPVSELLAKRNQLRYMKYGCEEKLNDHLSDLNRTYSGLNVIQDHFQVYGLIVSVLDNYLLYFNVSKFEIADRFMDNTSEEVHSWMEETRKFIASDTKDILHGLLRAIDCLNQSLYSEVSEDESVSHAFEIRGWELGVNRRERERLLNDTKDSIKMLQDLSFLKTLHTEHLSIVKAIKSDANEFTNRAVIDVSFYSENFIFLNIFFSEISYTVTEQQVAYAIFNLLSDIGGSMGLLLGASVVSLLEFLDFFFRLSGALWRRKKPVNENRLYG